MAGKASPTAARCRTTWKRHCRSSPTPRWPHWCAGRTDAGVHAFNQVVHFDAPVTRDAFSWVRGTNRYLPNDIAVQWCREVPADFHARNQARGRR